MQPTTSVVTRISEIISKGSSGAIVVPLNPSVDAVASATSLYLGLLKLGKSVILVSETPVKSDLIGSDKFQSTLAASGDNLVVAFPYTEGAIDKVDYNIQGNFFNLIISPRQGYPKLNPQDVKYTYSGGVLDFLLVLDAPNLNSLGTVYTDNQTQFQGKEIINIDRHLTNSFYGTVNFVNKTSSSTSELILKILQALNVEFDKDIATNVYAGITVSTNNFSSYSVTAETFESASYLLKMGAVKKPTYRPQNMQSSIQPPMMNRPSFNAPSAPMVQPAIQAVRSFEKQTAPISTVEQGPQPSNQGTSPQDWLKPKIFKNGSGII